MEERIDKRKELDDFMLEEVSVRAMSKCQSTVLNAKDRMEVRKERVK